MNKHLVSVFKFLGLFLLGVLLMWLAFRGQNIPALIAELKSANYSWVIVSMLMVLIAHLLRAMRWIILIVPTGYKPSVLHSFYAVMIGYMANMFLPRMGEVAKCGVLNRTDKVPVTVSVGTVIVERLFDLMALVIIIMVTFLLQYDLVYDFMAKYIFSKFQDKLNVTTIGLMIVVLAGLAFVIYFGSKILMKAKGHKIAELMKGLKSGLLSFFHMKNKGLFLLYTLGIWLFYYLSVYTCFYALSATKDLGFDAAFTVLLFSSLAMAMPVQGGIGVFHWLVAQALVLYLIPNKDGLAFSFLIHSAQTLAVFVIGGLSLLLVMLAAPKKVVA